MGKKEFNIIGNLKKNGMFCFTNTKGGRSFVISLLNFSVKSLSPCLWSRQNLPVFSHCGWPPLGALAVFPTAVQAMPIVFVGFLVAGSGPFCNLLTLLWSMWRSVFCWTGAWIIWME